jgi:hypothetical protein
MKNLIIARIVDFAELVGRRISSIAMIVACALIKACIQTKIARVENTSPTVQFVKSFFSVLGVLLMKCLAAMPFTGSAFGNLLLMIPGVPFVRKLRKRVNA